MTPKYMRIKEAILSEIRGGSLQAGQPVDSISEIVAKYKVSKVTAVHALAALEAEGFVRREHGRGTFVTEHSDQAIRSLERKTVALIVPDMVNPFNVEIVRSIERRLRGHEVVCELYSTDGTCDAEQAVLDRLRLENKVSGVVVVCYATPGDYAENAIPNVPIVAIDYRRPSLRDKCVFISSDNFKGGYDAAVHLITLGHKRIGCVLWGEVSQKRIEGFISALREHNVPFDEDSMMFFTSDHSSVGAGFVDFVQKNELTAVFATNDMLAMQVMQQLRASGVRVPEDISLVGYDNVLAAQYLEVPLTTIEQYEEQIAQRAAESLLEYMAEDAPPFMPKEIVIVPTIIARKSTGAPKS